MKAAVYQSARFWRGKGRDFFGSWEEVSKVGKVGKVRKVSLVGS
ncbi:MAG: hypothetical protein JWR02_1997 [Mucilaginibacter sp.]|nr:hypothetical protein [Mucilaginibacter sp.]